MGAEGAVDPAALDAHDDGEVDGHPFRLDAGPAVRTPAVALVGFAQDLEQLVGALVESGAGFALVGGTRTDGGATEDVVLVEDGGVDGLVGCVGGMAEGGALACQDGADVAPDGGSFLRCSWGCDDVLDASAFHSTLKCVIDSRYPARHIFLRCRLVYSGVMRSDYFKTEPSFGIPSLSNRCQAEVDRVHMEIKLFLPVAVFRKFSLVKDDPKSTEC